MGKNFNPFFNINLNIKITPENSVIKDYDFENNIAYIETHGDVRAMITVKLEDVNTVQEFVQLLKFLRCSETVTAKKEYTDFLAENPIFRVFEPWEVIVHRVLNMKVAEDIQKVCSQLANNHCCCNLGRSEAMHCSATGGPCSGKTKFRTLKGNLPETAKDRHKEEVLLTALTELVKDNTIYQSPYGEYTIYAANEKIALEYIDNLPYEIKRFTEYPKAVIKSDYKTDRTYIIGVIYRGIYAMPDGTEKESYIFSCEQEEADIWTEKAVRDYINYMAAKKKKKHK